MLADQFVEAADGARTPAVLDDLARKLWRAHAERQIEDADAEAISGAIEARRAALGGNAVFGAKTDPKAALGLPRASRRRDKVFGLGRPRALDRNAKVRVMHWARCLSRRTEKGKAYGQITAKALAVLEALLWAFHNGKSGLCFPSYERIAEAAGCALVHRRGASCAGGRWHPFMGPSAQAGAGALPRSVRRGRRARGAAADQQRLSFHRSLASRRPAKSS